MLDHFFLTLNSDEHFNNGVSPDFIHIKNSPRRETCGSFMDTDESGFDLEDTCVSGIVAPAEENKLKGSHTVRRKVQALTEVVNITTAIYLTIDVRTISR